MKVVPLLQCPNLAEAIDFYTRVLDFTLKHPNEGGNDWGVELTHGTAEIALVRADGTPCISICVVVDDVDSVYQKYLSRGLVVPNHPDSPVHHQPINQTWGLREFYVNDPAGNTLRFVGPIR
jgi:catechol 2,3-dioxygenase-like lactoylglutathione lyase family enzyme